jgi:hypothetical protein
MNSVCIFYAQPLYLLKKGGRYQPVKKGQTRREVEPEEVEPSNLVVPLLKIKDLISYQVSVFWR